MIRKSGGTAGFSAKAFGRQEFEDAQFAAQTREKLKILSRIGEREGEYDLIFLVLILVNLMVIGIETDLPDHGVPGADSASSVIESPFFWIELFFFLAFSAELYLRFRSWRASQQHAASMPFRGSAGSVGRPSGGADDEVCNAPRWSFSGSGQYVSSCLSSLGVKMGIFSSQQHHPNAINLYDNDVNLKNFNQVGDGGGDGSCSKTVTTRANKNHPDTGAVVGVEITSSSNKKARVVSSAAEQKPLDAPFCVNRTDHDRSDAMGVTLCSPSTTDMEKERSLRRSTSGSSSGNSMRYKDVDKDFVGSGPRACSIAQMCAAKAGVAASGLAAAGTSKLQRQNANVMRLTARLSNASKDGQKIIALATRSVSLSHRLWDASRPYRKQVAAAFGLLMRHAWTIFDTFIIVCSFLDLLVLLLYGKDEIGTIVIFRLLRVMRVFRTVKLLRYCKSLWLLCHGLIAAFSTIVWIAGLLLFLIYASAVFLTRLIGQDPDYCADEPKIDEYFGTVGSSMYSLFIVLTLEEWPARADPVVRAVGPGMALFFIGYIIVTNFTVLNLVVGVICEHIQSLASTSDLDLMRQVQQDRRIMQEKLLEIFGELDTDKNGELTKEELAQSLNDDQIRAILLRNEIHDEELHWLFEVLDRDGSETLTIEEFVNGVMALKSSEQARDLVSMQYTLVKEFNTLSKVHEQKVEALDEDFRSLKSELLHRMDSAVNRGVEAALRDILLQRGSMNKTAASPSFSSAGPHDRGGLKQTSGSQSVGARTSTTGSGAMHFQPMALLAQRMDQQGGGTVKDENITVLSSTTTCDQEYSGRASPARSKQVEQRSPSPSESRSGRSTLVVRSTTNSLDNVNVLSSAIISEKAISGGGGGSGRSLENPQHPNTAATGNSGTRMMMIATSDTTGDAVSGTGDTTYQLPPSP
ncbi:unnamed protein product [Amoebophrya sp. A25]|nr:unnamed protein product [Amoebophrya sp. A25]|eukprot:GSA25T00011452001.1